MPASPTARTLAECKRRGWTADVVEKWIPQARKRKDVAGCIDVLTYGVGVGVLGIQTTSGSNHAARRTKALAEPRLRMWLLGGGRFELWSWSKLANGRWTVRKERVVMDDDGMRVEVA